MINYGERDFRRLKMSLMRKNRYIFEPKINEIINKIRDFMKQRIKVLKKEETLLWRAQIVSDIDEVDEDSVCPLKRDRMFPLENKATEGRANPKGIAYVYLAENEAIAISEVRPWPGKYVSCGTFGIKRNIRLIDFSLDKENSLIIDFYNNLVISKNTIENLWGELNAEFARPVDRNNDTAEYVTTQLVSEIVRSEGYDGIIYNSGYSNENVKGCNIVIFDREILKLKMNKIYRIDNIKFNYSEVNNPHYYSD
jgi:hypothetical protein